MHFIFYLFSWLLPAPGSCSCTPPGPIDDRQYNSYQLIAKGKIESVTVNGFERTILFKADTCYKGGENQSRIKIITPKQEGACGLFPKTGEAWLIFAYADGPDFRTHLCTRTKNLDPKSWNYNQAEIENDTRFLEQKKKNMQQPEER